MGAGREERLDGVGGRRRARSPRWRPGAACSWEPGRKGLREEKRCRRLPRLTRPPDRRGREGLSPDNSDLSPGDGMNEHKTYF